jgi:acyl-coenzyme A synthetase/AMP-(fatty) acid ligase/acyl carrier protein
MYNGCDMTESITAPASELSTRVSAPESYRSIAEQFAVIAAMHAERMAVCTEFHQFTYARIDAASNTIACAILDLQPSSPAPVALMLEHDAPLIAAILAVLKTGRPYVVVDAAAPPAHRESILVASGASLLLHDASLPDRTASTHPISTTIDIENALSARASRNPPTCDIAPHAPAAITFTSGTTGQPKAFMQSHAFLLHHCRNYTAAAHLVADDRISLLTPCSLAASMSSLWGALLNGAALYPFDIRRCGVNAIPVWAQRNEISVLHCVPTVFRAIAQSLDADNAVAMRPSQSATVSSSCPTPNFADRQMPSTNPALASLRILRLGGETILPRDVELFKRHTNPACKLFVALSSTETGAISAMLHDHHTVIRTQHVPLGRPQPGATIQLLGSDGNPTPVGHIGRLFVQSAHLAAGYLHQPADKKGDAPHFGISTQSFFDTGDLARITPDGLLEHHGRGDSQLKIRGFRANSIQIETALLALPSIHQAAVIATGNTAPQLTAFIAGPPHQLPPDRDLRIALRQTLPDHLIPAAFVRLPALPQTPGGKIDRQALHPLIPAASTPCSIPPIPRASARDPLEIQATQLFKNVLGIPHVNRTDDFFADLGGTSLQAATVVTSIEQATGVRLPLSAMVHHPTVETLAAFVSRQAIHSTVSPLVLLKDGTTKPFFLIHRGHGGLYGYRQLIAGLDADQTVYGLQCVGLQGEAWPLASIRAMADRYIQEILTVQPAGPYLLGGACLGGLIALEIAQQLHTRGHQTALLCMFDTTHPGIGGHRTDVRSKIIDRVAHGFRLLRWRSLWLLDRSTQRRMQLTAGPPFRRFVSRTLSRARRRYDPRPYPGTIDIFIGRHPDPTELRRRLALGNLAPAGCKTHQISAPTLDLLVSPGVEAIAPKLQCLIRSAIGV